jgi:hypothetical protein
MSGKSLSELELKEETLPAQAFDDLPDFGAFTPPPQPGPYRFTLPADLSKTWDVYETAKGQRVRLVLDRDAPLTIVASPGNKANGDSFQTRLSNQERKRGNVEASDLDYLLRAFGVKTRPAGNKATVEVVSGFAGKTFGADITYSFGCNDTKNIRVVGADGKLEEVQGRLGCGKKYYQKDLSKDAQGNYPDQVQCACGAVLRVFANLDNIRA